MSSDGSSLALSTRATIGLVLVGFGAIGVPLEAAGFYLGLGLPLPVLLAVSVVLGLVGGWLLTPQQPLKGLVGGPVAALASTAACLGYIYLWGTVVQRTVIWDIELVLPVLFGGAAGVIAAGLAHRVSQGR